MNKYILMLGVTGVSIGSYAAYAGNSATMTVTATINHDVSLSVTQDLDLGTITINPAYEMDETEWSYSDTGAISLDLQGAIISAPDATVGTFTANIPNPSACNTASDSCGGLSFLDHITEGIFGEKYAGNYCKVIIKYSGNDNIFKVYPDYCQMYRPDKTSVGSHSATLTIQYTAS
ncbi:MAG: hypothetical protein IJ689_06940 [Alphaproteobacteria bacterium]|nr:hypothetical protein [Alphaproteobacteria bacterium]